MCTDTEDTCTDTEDTCTDTIVLCRMFSSSEYFSEIDKFHGSQHRYTSRITLHHFFLVNNCGIVNKTAILYQYVISS